MMRTPGSCVSIVDPLDVGELVVDLRVQGHGRLDRGLGMKLRREGNLEQHVFHHVAAEGLAASVNGLALNSTSWKPQVLAVSADG